MMHAWQTKNQKPLTSSHQLSHPRLTAKAHPDTVSHQHHSPAPARTLSPSAYPAHPSCRVLQARSRKRQRHCRARNRRDQAAAAAGLLPCSCVDCGGERVGRPGWAVGSWILRLSRTGRHAGRRSGVRGLVVVGALEVADEIDAAVRGAGCLLG